jgi:hypothetical protein
MLHLPNKANIYRIITYRAICVNDDVTRSKDFPINGKTMTDFGFNLPAKKKKRAIEKLMLPFIYKHF